MSYPLIVFVESDDGEPIMHVVVTDDAQRQAVHDAAEMSYLHTEDLPITDADDAIQWLRETTPS